MANVAFNDYYVPGKSNYVYLFAFSVDGGANWVYGLTNNQYYKSWIYIDPLNFGRLNLLNPVVISEVSTRGSTGNDEYVEIYNRTNIAVDISGWKLQYKQNTGGSWSTKVTLLSGVTIAAHSYFLFGSSDSSYSGPARDATFTAGLADNGHIRILDSSNNVIDTVGFNGGDAAEGGAPATNPCSTNPCLQSVERKAKSTSTSATMESGGEDEFLGNGYDTNNNANDFIVRSTKDPQNSSSPPEP